MQLSINSFLGVPYLWGGNTRRGVDCSGFTRNVYREQGVLIPRVSRDQYRTGRAVEDLTYGDLVFFNKNGWGRVTHVGIYVGNGEFAHASCSRGVTVSRLNKHYYRKRYVGARRILS
ncbi:NlpC/P60 family protein [bacterium]|nr:NlpC/P60 family protein [bacterium]